MGLPTIFESWNYLRKNKYRNDQFLQLCNTFWCIRICYFAICSNIMTEILMVWQPWQHFLSSKIFRGKSAGNPSKTLNKSPSVLGSGKCLQNTEPLSQLKAFRNISHLVGLLFANWQERKSYWKNWCKKLSKDQNREKYRARKQDRLLTNKRTEFFTWWGRTWTCWSSRGSRGAAWPRLGKPTNTNFWI